MKRDGAIGQSFSLRCKHANIMCHSATKLSVVIYQWEGKVRRGSVAIRRHKELRRHML